jgi:hypothetical protein
MDVKEANNECLPENEECIHGNQCIENGLGRYPIEKFFVIRENIGCN